MVVGDDQSIRRNKTTRSPIVESHRGKAGVFQPRVRKVEVVFLLSSVVGGSLKSHMPSSENKLILGMNPRRKASRNLIFMFTKILAKKMRKILMPNTPMHDKVIILKYHDRLSVLSQAKRRNHGSFLFGSWNVFKFDRFCRCGASPRRAELQSLHAF